MIGVKYKSINGRFYKVIEVARNLERPGEEIVVLEDLESGDISCVNYRLFNRKSRKVMYIERFRYVEDGLSDIKECKLYDVADFIPYNEASDILQSVPWRSLSFIKKMKYFFSKNRYDKKLYSLDKIKEDGWKNNIVYTWDNPQHYIEDSDMKLEIVNDILEVTFKSGYQLKMYQYRWREGFLFDNNYFVEVWDYKKEDDVV
jgi:hypothetical protein